MEEGGPGGASVPPQPCLHQFIFFKYSGLFLSFLSLDFFIGGFFLSTKPTLFFFMNTKFLHKHFQNGI